ncbi:DNA/RNA helicase domain-containing protein [Paenibacillus lautus]|uniref:DNA/RNA helicase domain-containing protein n=1 Tax=Paenibacillus lautus TaxID=1401 RepID=UPI0013E376B8
MYSTNVGSLTGGPGAGKTLSLLYTAYHLNLFLSGNDPLVYTLSHVLSRDNSINEGSSFIKGVKNYKSEFYDKFKSTPIRNEFSIPTILFDEAQRAWNFEHMNQYRFPM